MPKGCLINFRVSVDPEIQLHCVFVLEDGTIAKETFKYTNYFYVSKSFDLSCLNNTPCQECEFFDLKSNTVQKYVKVIATPESAKYIPKAARYEADLSLKVKIARDYDLHPGLYYEYSDTEPYLKKCEDSHVAPCQIPYVVFDIEVCKKPHKFPDSEQDEIMSIGFVTNKSKYILINAKHVGSTGEDHVTYQGNNKYKGCSFTLIYFPTESRMLATFANVLEKCSMMVTYNGDVFDNIYLQKRMIQCGVKFPLKCIYKEFIYEDVIHLDLFHWVERDSYLPKGKRGLKAVAQSLLGFTADELDPEDMMRVAMDDPETFLLYNASDVIATLMLKEQYVENFLLALCTIIPMPLDDILRKGTGAICDIFMTTLVKQLNIMIPCKETYDSQLCRYGHWIKSETYAGGSVESSVIGIHHGNHDQVFPFSQAFYDELMCKIEPIIHRSLEAESVPVNTVVDMSESVENIQQELIRYHTESKHQKYKIYHYDVMAMYPNIILTYFLEPYGIHATQHCSACVKMYWTWKGDVWNITREEFIDHILPKLMQSTDCQMSIEDMATDPARLEDFVNFFADKTRCGTFQALCKRFVETNRKRPQILHITKPDHVYVCQKAKPYFTYAVELMKNKRYECKRLLKEAIRDHKDPAYINRLENLQKSYKCLLNSFYGWLKMPGSRVGHDGMITAALVCHQARNIIESSDTLLDAFSLRVNRDTDGTYRKIPNSFPKNIIIKTQNKNISINFVNAILNYHLLLEFTNHDRMIHDTKVDHNSLFFEADGPYACMFLPSSDTLANVKKKYVVIDDAGRICDIKGLEIKRRGEWSLIVEFQEKFFSVLKTLQCDTIDECYDQLKSQVLDELDALFDTHAFKLSGPELLHMFTETQVTSKCVSEYARPIPVVCAIKRWMELDANIVDSFTANLSCGYIVAKVDASDRKSDKVIPIKVFNLPLSETCRFIQKWTGQEYTTIHELLDWNYYTERWIHCRNRLYTHPRSFQCIHDDVFVNKQSSKRKRTADVVKVKKMKQYDLFHFFKKSE